MSNLNNTNMGFTHNANMGWKRGVHHKNRMGVWSEVEDKTGVCKIFKKTLKNQKILLRIFQKQNTTQAQHTQTWTWDLHTMWKWDSISTWTWSQDENVKQSRAFRTNVCKFFKMFEKSEKITKHLPEVKHRKIGPCQRHGQAKLVLYIKRAREHQNYISLHILSKLSVLS